MSSTEEMYVYAIGYYDGRAVGHKRPDDMRPVGAFAFRYKEGYERGVSDYCEEEIEPSDEGSVPS